MGTIVLGPVGLFGHNFVKGKDVRVAPSHLFSAYLDHTQTVAATTNYTSMSVSRRR